MSYSLEEKVKNFAVLSRLGIVTLQFVANIIIPNHDAGVFQKPHHPNITYNLIDRAIHLGFGGLTRWDGQYFLHIAQYGYTYENTLAFFPLFPLVSRHLSSLVSFFIIQYIKHAFIINTRTEIISTHSLLVLVSVVFNNILFVKTARILFKLSLLVLKKEKLAYVSAILFCVNPASIFFSAVYSESLYCFLVFYGLLKIEEKSSLVNYLIIGLTTCTRSNGIVNIGFLVYKFIKLKFKSKLSFFQTIIFNFGMGLSFLPFIAYQFYCFAKFCFRTNDPLPGFISSYGEKFNYMFPGDIPDWCKNPIPFAYSHVQKHYWNVGFLNYYELKQIPNFLLAAPMVYIIFRGSYSYIKQYKFFLFYLGFIQCNHGRELPISVFPYILHALVLTIFCVLMIHVQVTTRLLASSSPVPYWFCAKFIASFLKHPLEGEVLKKLSNKNENRYFYESCKNRKSRWKTFLFEEKLSGFPLFIKWYFLSYCFFGTVLFSNFFPWT